MKTPGAILMNFHSMMSSCSFNRNTTFSQAVTDKVLLATFNEKFLVLIRPVTTGCRYGRNFVVKCGGTVWCEINVANRVDSEVQFNKYRFPILFIRGVLKATLITLVQMIYKLIYSNLLLDTALHVYFSNMISIPNFYTCAA